MIYKHGIEILEESTNVAIPVSGTTGLQVVFGTAPVNMAEDPYGVSNKLILAYSYEDAVRQLGYSEDYDSYTLCQSMYASFKLFNVAPIILCNVLDPEKHKRSNAEASLTVLDNQVRLPEKGILLNTVVVKHGAIELVRNVDYALTFDTLGNVLVTLVAGGAGEGVTELDIKSDSIDPTMVEKEDIIGGYNSETGVEKGIELVRQVYPKFNLAPGSLLAPGWSQFPEVGAVLAEKCKSINGAFRCISILDLDTEKTKTYHDCKKIKEESGFTSEYSVSLWPMLQADRKLFAYSAIYASMVAYTDVSNDNVPNISPSNELLNAERTCLKDGTEIVTDQEQAATLNGEGIVTAINNGGWRSWGNNTSCYPGNKDPKDRWISCRRFFNWWGNSFVLTYQEKVDDPANFRLIEALVDNENIRGNAYTATGKCAGAYIEFIESENTVETLLEGKLRFRQFLAPYTPAEHIQNVLEFDPAMLATALGGNNE